MEVKVPKIFVNFRKITTKILKESKKPLSADEIIKIAKKKGLLKSKGKTPEATLRALLSRDVSKSDKKSDFKLVEKGKYTLDK